MSAKPETRLVGRYLAAVSRRLPEDQRQDIVAELHEAITARIEAREAETGAPASADDVGAILKSFGHPVVVAARFSGRDYLIGPGLYPWFWPAQRAVIGVVLAVVIALSAVDLLDSARPVSAAIHVLGGLWEMALMAFAVVTGIFVVMERTGTPLKIAGAWNPKSLPQDDVRPPKTLFDSLFTLAFDILFILFWTRAVAFPNEMPVQGEGAASLNLSPAWAALHMPILVLAVITAAVHVADILHPAWSRLRAVVSIVGHLWALAILFVLFRSRPLLEATPVGMADPEASASALHMVSLIVDISLAVAAIVWAAGIGLEVWRLTRGGKSPLLAKA